LLQAIGRRPDRDSADPRGHHDSGWPHTERVLTGYTHTATRRRRVCRIGHRLLSRDGSCRSCRRRRQRPEFDCRAQSNAEPHRAHQRRRMQQRAGSTDTAMVVCGVGRLGHAALPFAMSTALCVARLMARTRRRSSPSRRSRDAPPDSPRRSDFRRFGHPPRCLTIRRAKLDAL
jgi:hypothetical protein